jgi:hypothetical protein
MCGTAGKNGKKSTPQARKKTLGEKPKVYELVV